MAIVAVLVLASSASFGLGYLSGLDAGQGGPPEFSQAPLATSSPLGQFVASRSGTKYYLPWCAGVDRITDPNKIWFQTEDEAIAQGYSAAANCKGL